MTVGLSTLLGIIASGGNAGGGLNPALYDDITVVEAFEVDVVGTTTYTFVATLLEDDIVIVARSTDVVAGSRAISGYTTVSEAGDSIPGYAVNLKRMGATPDIDVDLPDFGSSTHRCPCTGVVLRGVDATTAQNVTADVVSGTASSLNVGSVTTTIPKCFMLITAHLDDDPTAVVSTYPTNYTLAQKDFGSFNACTAQCGYIKVVEGVESPANIVMSLGDQYRTVLMALQPALL